MDKIFEISGLISTLSADASSMYTLASEVSEGVEANSSDYFKLHAVCTIAERQMQLIEQIDDIVMALQ